MNRSLMTSLCLATALGTVNLAQATQPSPQEFSTFLDRAGEGNLEAVKAWIAQGRDVNAKNNFGTTALMAASAYGHLSVVQYLLENGADATIKDTYGLTARDQAKDGFGDQKQIIMDLLDKAMKDSEAKKG